MADPVVIQLASLLAQVDDGGPAGPIFVDGVSIALACRLFTLNSMRGGAPVSNGSTPLPKWRLKRVVDYIDANLTKPIYLAELSNVAGLTLMHFAAQFRAATGCSPCKYILRKKVAYSQQLLLDPQLSIANVTAMTGFSSQAHFTYGYLQEGRRQDARSLAPVVLLRPLEANQPTARQVIDPLSWRSCIQDTRHLEREPLKPHFR
jgi:AraC-like DNA-binding protein